MGKRSTQHTDPPVVRNVRKTAQFRAWQGGLDPARKEKLSAGIKLVREVGPTLGRPHVDVIHGSRVNKLKELRIDEGARVLFAFDSNRDPVMLLGGDKSSKWNRWYPKLTRLAETLLQDHERSIGKEARCLAQREAGRTSTQMSR